MKKLFLFIMVLPFLFSCENAKEKISISDQVSKNRYYPNEIFNEHNQNIYGKWEYLFNSGSSQGVDVRPGYLYLEIVRYGIYGKIADNSIKEIGKLILESQTNDTTFVTFWSDDIFRSDYFLVQKIIRFEGNDTLILDDNYAGGFSDYYKRVK
jgi:hypothetical protein